jgi:hypothetical protein
VTSETVKSRCVGVLPDGRRRSGYARSFYAVALLASAVAAFGVLSESPLSPHDYEYEWLTYGSKGLVPGLAVLFGWSLVWLCASRPLGLATVVCGVLVLYFVWNWFVPTPSCSRGAANRQECRSNLERIGQALADYHDAHGMFPPACLSDGKDMPSHSWRVLLLPFLGHERLYKQYHFDEPWDGPRNRLLAAKMPDVYRCPSRYGKRNPNNRTSYLAVRGPQTMWPDAASRRLANVPDGLDNSLTVVEADPREVNWMEPRDIRVDDAVRLLASAGRRRPHAHIGGGNMLHADGRVHFHLYGRPAAYWAPLFTVKGGDLPAAAVPDQTPDAGSRSRLAMQVPYVVFLLISLLPLAGLGAGRTSAAPVGQQRTCRA